jgi:hypothetical protein
MSMFDYIKCEYELPESSLAKKLGVDFSKVEFQTKDMENSMSTYTITKNGEFWFRKDTYKWVDDDNAFLKGYMDIVSSEDIKLDYHGILNFYCYEEVEENEDKTFAYSVDFQAKFTDGKLIEIKITQEESRDVTENKKAIKNLLEEDQIKRKKWYNKFIFRTKTYGIFRKQVFNLVRSWLNLNQKIYHLALRYL